MVFKITTFWRLWMVMEILSSCFWHHTSRNRRNERESQEAWMKLHFCWVRILARYVPSGDCAWCLQISQLKNVIFSPRKKCAHSWDAQWVQWFAAVGHLLPTSCLCVQSTQDIRDAQIVCSASLTFPRCVSLTVNVQSCFSHMLCICPRFLHNWQPYQRNFSSQGKI